MLTDNTRTQGSHCPKRENQRTMHLSKKYARTPAERVCTCKCLVMLSLIKTLIYTLNCVALYFELCLVTVHSDSVTVLYCATNCTTQSNFYFSLPREKIEITCVVTKLNRLLLYTFRKHQQIHVHISFLMV